jgi:hypothetical protein
MLRTAKATDDCRRSRYGSSLLGAERIADAVDRKHHSQDASKLRAKRQDFCFVVKGSGGSLVKVASETDNLDLIREHHREVLALCQKGAPGRTKAASGEDRGPPWRAEGDGVERAGPARQ